MESLALNVTGQNWSGEKVSLSLKNWELARVALSCHVVAAKVSVKERDVVREIEVTS